MRLQFACIASRFSDVLHCFLFVSFFMSSIVYDDTWSPFALDLFVWCLPVHYNFRKLLLLEMKLPITAKRRIKKTGAEEYVEEEHELVGENSSPV